MSDAIQFQRADGSSAPGFLEEVTDGGLGGAGVVLIQEFWGVNAPFLALAERFAAAGFRVLVPDLYRGAVTSDAEEAGALMQGLDWDEALLDVQGAVRHLKADGGAVAVIGFCLGGAVTIAACAKLTECDAGVCFYGIPSPRVADPSEVRVPIQAHFASRDDWCTPAAVDALEASWQQAGVNHELHRYDAAHAFMNESRAEVYDEEAAGQAWDAMVSFLLRTIC